ncbi:MAG: hypothetical protein DRH03_05255 [Deltaproteobacteria bacterium]|nr:MAG: hypothetical protein DRH03_05255 [Deltaproteobacteria bacterium]
MSRETQLDTHEIDKLLDDDDFIDDFDFSDDQDDQFAGIEDSSAESLDDDLAPAAADTDLDTFIIDDEPGKSETLETGRGSVVTNELAEALDLNFDNFEIDYGRFGKSRGKLLPVVVGLVVLLWLAQLGGVIYLLRQPVVVRDQNQPLAVETTVQPMAEKSDSEDVTAPESVDSESPEEPDIYVFTSYVKLYSLDGLKVFSVEIELVQYQKRGRLTDAEKVVLKESLRQVFAESVAGHMREEVVDLSAQLMAIIVPHIEHFFSARGVDPEKIKIRVHNPIFSELHVD